MHAVERLDARKIFGQVPDFQQCLQQASLLVQEGHGEGGDDDCYRGCLKKSRPDTLY
jgi:hypothetical protein